MAVVWVIYLFLATRMIVEHQGMEDSSFPPTVYGKPEDENEMIKLGD